MSGLDRCREDKKGRRDRHVFPPFKETDDLGGGAQTCECGRVEIDRTLGGGRVVEIDRRAGSHD